MTRTRTKAGILLLVLVAGGTAAFVCAFFVGSSGLSWRAFVELARGEAADAVYNIFINIRLPRALGGFFTGAALAVSGCCLQGVFKNPMADPFVMGVSAGALLGATIAMMFIPALHAAGVGAITALSFICALAAVYAVYNIARVRGKVSAFSLILSGFALSALLTSVVYMLMLMNRDKMESVVMWNMGSLSAISWPKLYLSVPVVMLCSVILMRYAKPLNIMLNGDEVAQSLGVDTHRTRGNILFFTALLTATAVSVSGIIGFVGLMIPHLLRMAVGPDHRRLLPLCFAGGGVFLLICDMIARVALPGRELPVGIVTSVIGVPFFIYLLRSGRKPAV